MKRLTAALLLGFFLASGPAISAKQSEPPPRLQVVHHSSLAAPGYVFVAPKTDRQASQGPEIVDDRGRAVWFDPLSHGDQATDFRVQRYQGKPVLTWWQSSSFPSGGGQGEIADGSYHVIATVHPGNGLDGTGHEFVLTPQGTALITINHDVPYDLSSLGGSANGTVVEGVVQGVDVATGRVLFEWHSLDHVPLDESHERFSMDSSYDYFHLNSANLDSDGNLLISGRHTWTVYKVDKHSGQILWRLGGKRSDFALGAGVQFAWQHDPLPAGENTIRLFDNESNGSDFEMEQSRVIWIHLDTDAKTARLVRTITHPAHVSSESQGNAQGLANGDTFVGWGATGRISEFDPQGSLVFDARLSGYDTYRAYRAEWTGEPDTKPIATARRNGRRTTVHAIWNGATAVRTWRVLAGRKATKLRRVGAVAWNGLDTTVKIKGRPREVEVLALDASGQVIGTSKPVRAAPALR
jgi:arylsulfotransferase ASST